jgi:membrane fusion protein (multidrug efflux system)
MADCFVGRHRPFVEEGVKLATSSPSRPSLFMSVGPGRPACNPGRQEKVRFRVMAIRSTPPIRQWSAALLAALLLSACGGSDPKGGAGGRAGSGGAMGPTQVGFVVVQQGSAPLEQQLPGRVSAYQVSEVRPQVSGVILRRLFREGSIVRQGQTLYQIDPSIYSAQAAQAAANLQSARANAEAARTLAARYKPLVAQEAISKQDYTNAVSQAQQADAAIAQNAANLRAAQVNVRWTRVPAPITGRIGLSNVTEGALVTANQADSLTTITRLDPVYVDIQESAADLLALRRALSEGGVTPTAAQVRLKLPDGSDYGSTGTVEFSQVLVNQDTGTVTLRARFANPQSILLPGMFVTAVFAQAIDTSAFLVPQQAVSRDPKGNATLWVVGPGNRAVQRVIVADRTQGSYWVVTQGLAPGEKVITQGTANLRPDAPIKPVPATAPQRVQAPSPDVLKKMNASRRGG